MKRLVMWMTLIVGAAITAPIVFFIAALRGSMKEAEQWGAKRLPWWSLCNSIEKAIWPGPPKVRKCEPNAEWEEDTCSQCGKWHTSLIYKHNDVEEKWCAKCWQTHHDPNFVPPQPESVWGEHCWL